MSSNRSPTTNGGRWRTFVMIASVAVNLAFFAGFVHATVQRQAVRDAGTALRAAIQHLGLDAAQEASLRRHRRAAGDAARRLQARTDGDLDAFWREIAGESPDWRAADAGIRRVAEQRAAFSQAVARELRGFLADLDSGQRAEFIDLVRHRPLLQGLFTMTAPRAGQGGTPTANRNGDGNDQ